MSPEHTPDIRIVWMITLSRMLYVEDDFRKLSSPSIATTGCIVKTAVMSIRWTQWAIFRVARVYR